MAVGEETVLEALNALRSEVSPLRTAIEDVRREIEPLQSARTGKAVRWVMGTVLFCTVVLAGGLLHLRLDVGANTRALIEAESRRKLVERELQQEVSFNKERHSLLMARLQLMERMLDRNGGVSSRKR